MGGALAELENPDAGDRVVRSAAFWFAVVGVVCAVIVFGCTILVVAYGFPYWADILKDHFAAIIGLPGAAAVAFILVIFLRQTDGPIEFEGFGFKIKGAAGQVILWAICFFVIAGAIKMLW
jgi:hypothetical protein